MCVISMISKWSCTIDGHLGRCCDLFQAFNSSSVLAGYSNFDSALEEETPLGSSDRNRGEWMRCHLRVACKLRRQLWTVATCGPPEPKSVPLLCTTYVQPRHRLGQASTRPTSPPAQHIAAKFSSNNRRSSRSDQILHTIQSIGRPGERAIERVGFQRRSQHANSMASTPGFMYKFPWDDWGNGKYLLMAPFLATVLLGCDDADNWSMHVLCIAAMRYLNAQLWQMASRANSISEKTRIQTKLLEFKQIDREDNWDDYIILQSLIMTLVHHVLPGYSNFPLFNSRGFWHCLVCHVGPTEFIYYWFHRVLHHHSLYSAYHSHHHASFLTEPVSGTFRLHLVGWEVK